MTPAARLTNEIRASVSKVGARLFNVHVGKFWAGVVVRKFTASGLTTIDVRAGDILLRASRVINAGVAGMSDLGGWTPVTITSEMVGTVVAVHTVIEVKAGNDRPRPEQVAFVEAVRKAGGLAGFARSPGDAVRIVTGDRP